MRSTTDLGFYDVINRYGNVMWGLGAALYLILAATVFFAVDEDNSTGLEQSRAVNYFCLVSIVVLCVSIARQWTWPIKVDEALLAVFVWILITNLLPRDCACCSENTPPLTTLGLHTTDNSHPPPVKLADSMKNHATLERASDPIKRQTISTKEHYKDAVADEEEEPDEYVFVTPTPGPTPPKQHDQDDTDDEDEYIVVKKKVKKGTASNNSKKPRRTKRAEEAEEGTASVPRTRSFHSEARKNKATQPGPPSGPAVLLNYYTTATGDQCNWTVFTIVYSLLAVAPMLISFLINARSRWVSLLASVISLLLMIGATLIPISCNQFDPSNVNLNLVKFTLYCIIWLINKQMRLTEIVLSNQYRHSIEWVMAYRYKPVAHRDALDELIYRNTSDEIELYGEGAQYMSTLEEESNYYYYYQPQGATKPVVPQKTNGRPTSSDEQPLHIFRTLERLQLNIRERNDKKIRVLVGGGGGASSSGKKKGNQKNKKGSLSLPPQLTREDIEFNAILAHLLMISDVHRRSVEGRWLNSFFSWKNRFYDASLQNIYDLTRTIWILNVCPGFLAFILLEYLFIIYNIRYNKIELAEVMIRAKSMSFIYKKELARHEQFRGVKSGAGGGGSGFVGV